MTNIKDLTKGKTILAANGAEYTILTKAPQTTGTERSEQEPNYLVMVRPAVGRAFDLILTQSSLDSGAYRLKS